MKYRTIYSQVKIATEELDIDINLFGVVFCGLQRNCTNSDGCIKIHAQSCVHKNVYSLDR